VSYCLPPSNCANRTIFSQCLIPAITLLSLLMSVACSSGSFPGSNTVTPAPVTTPTSTPTPSLSISTTTLPNATVGSDYNTTISTTGGASPYTFSVASGELPAGLSLGNSSGTISGTPTAGGNFSFAVSVSDSTGSSQPQALQLTIANPPATSTSASNSENMFSNVQNSSGWSGFGQQGPNYVDCSPSPCEGISFSMTQGVSSPSMSGHAAEFNVGGTAGFSDGLWNNHLIGPSSSQNLPDTSQTLIPTLHNFTYDVYFYGDNLSLSQALEFDVNQFFGNMGSSGVMSAASHRATNGMFGTISTRPGSPQAFRATRTAMHGITLRLRCNGHRTINWCISPSRSTELPTP
jgi:hypothetical protein